MPSVAAVTAASTACSPLKRILASDQVRFIAFDPPDGAQHRSMLQQIVVQVGSTALIALIVGAVLFVGFLPGFFLPAGVAGSTVAEQLLSRLSYWLVTIGSAAPTAFYEPTLMTTQWFGFYAAVIFVPFVVIRSAVEQACAGWDVAAYIAITLASFIVLAPIPQALARLTGERHWRNPLRWTIETWKNIIALWNTEAASLLVCVVASTLSVFTVLGDTLVFRNPSIQINQDVEQFVRPLAIACVGGIVKRCIRVVCEHTQLATVSTSAMWIGYTLLAFLVVRIPAAARDWTAFLLSVAFDWLLFLRRTITFWISCSPEAEAHDAAIQRGSRPSSSTCFTCCFTVARWTKVKPFPGTQPSDWRAFEFLVEGLTLTANYCAMSLLMLYFWLASYGPADPLHRFWFPHGSTSYQFIGLAAANDLLQDALGHLIVHVAAKRHKGRPTPSFLHVFPGWVDAWAPADRPGLRQLLLVSAAIIWVPALANWMAYDLYQRQWMLV